MMMCILPASRRRERENKEARGAKNMEERRKEEGLCIIDLFKKIYYYC